MRNFFLLFLVLIISLLANAQVVINEYSCSNYAIVKDNFNQYEDWVELYNTSGSSVNLSGYYLSDNSNTPLKWKITNATIAANGRLMVWASGRNVTSGTLHAGFKLTQTKPEILILSDAGGIVVDSLTLVPTQLNHSRGRTTDGASTWSIFTTPTPNAANTNAKQYYATRPTMSLAPGVYTGMQNVTISSPDTNVTIYYTTNGRTPTTASTQYTTPVPIANTTVLRARAFSSDPNIPASFVESNTYFIGTNHSVAVISIFGDSITNLMNGKQSNGGSNNPFEPQTGFEYFNNLSQFKAESYGQSNKHGNDSWAYNQRGIDFISRDEYGYNYAVLHKLFNMKSRKSFQRLILKAAANDNYPFETGGAHIRDSYVHHLSQTGGMYMDERTWEPCVLYVNGNYWGVYDLREKVDDDDFTEYYFNTPGDSLQFLKTWGNTWSEYGGPQAQTDWNNIRNFITGNNMAVQANYDYVDSLFNVKSFVDYFILNSFVVAKDWLNWNTAWWRGINYDANKKKWRYTLWDMDAVFGHYVNYTGIPNTSPTADPCDPENLPNPGGQGHTQIMKALLNNPGFKSYYLNRYADLLNTTLSCSNLINLLDSMIALIQPEMPGQISKWGGTMSGWQNNVNSLKNFINQRCTVLWQQFQDCPNYNTTGPFTIVVDVQPPGSGTVKINSITPANYAWSGSYFGNVTFSLDAKSNPGFKFDYWQLNNHTVNPNQNDSVVTFTLTKQDTIVAHFVQPQNQRMITYIVNPPLSGNIKANTYTIPTYPYTAGYSMNDTINLQALAAAGYKFKNWQLQNHTILPSVTDSTGSFIVNNNDTVIANFETIPSVTYIVIPAGSGNITANGTQVPSNPYTTYYQPGTNLSLQAMANSGFAFKKWQLINHTVSPSVNDSNVSLTINTGDTIIAYFANAYTITVLVNPPQTGNVIINSYAILTYPWTGSFPDSSNINIEAIPAANYQFDNWQSQNHIINPSVTAANASFIIITSDTIIAEFSEIPPPVNYKGIYVPTGFSPNGDNNNDELFVFSGYDVDTFIFVVYDRWGNQVFTAQDRDTGWNGKYKGKEAEQGVYAYQLQVKFKDGTAKNITGNITLVR